MFKCQSHVITTYWHHALTSTANLINIKQRFRSPGAEKAFFEVQYDVNTVRLPSDGTPTHHVLTPGVPSIHTFAIDNWDDVNYRFVDVSVEGWENQTDVVGKYMSVFSCWIYSSSSLFRFEEYHNTYEWSTCREGFYQPLLVHHWLNCTPGKMIVTQNKDELYNFLLSPNTSTLNSMRLGYSKFGEF